MDNLFEKGLVIIFLKMSDSKMISDVDYANFWIFDFFFPPNLPQGLRHDWIGKLILNLETELKPRNL